MPLQSKVISPVLYYHLPPHSWREGLEGRETAASINWLKRVGWRTLSIWVDVGVSTRTRRWIEDDPSQLASFRTSIRLRSVATSKPSATRRCEKSLATSRFATLDTLLHWVIWEQYAFIKPAHWIRNHVLDDHIDVLIHACYASAGGTRLK